MDLRIVIVGAGEVGYHLAKVLSNEDNDITLIETDAEKCRRASETLDVIVVEGSGGSWQKLTQANAGNADIHIAVTRTDEVNILSCMMAKELGAKMTISRVRNPEYSFDTMAPFRDRLNIDVYIHPEEAAADEIVRLIDQFSASSVVEFEGGIAKILAIPIIRNSPIAGLTLAQAGLRYRVHNALCVAILRDRETIIPRGEHRYQEGDTAYFIVESENVDEIMKMCGHQPHTSRRVMILGASRIGYLVARKLQSEKTVKVLDWNKDRALNLAEKLKDSMVVVGNGTDIDFLISEKIGEIDTFISVTDNQETNVISGLLARQLGARKMIVHVDTADYIPIMKKIGVDAVVSKNISTVNAILKYIRRGRIVSVSAFEDIHAEAIEFIPSGKSKIIEKPLRKIRFPEKAIVGAVFRNDAILIPDGNTVIQKGDRVIVFTEPEAIKKIEKFFL